MDPQNYNYQPQYNLNGYGQVAKPKYKSKYNPGNLLVFVACFIVGLSVFLPYLTYDFWGIETDTLKLIAYKGEVRDGIFFLILAILIAILNVFKCNVANIIFAIINCLLMIYEVSDTADMTAYDDYITYEAGYWMLIIGSILLVIFSVVGLIFKMSDKRKYMAS